MAKLALLFGVATLAYGQNAANVLVVVNQASALSRSIGEYYMLKRHVPLDNICKLNGKTNEDILRADFDKQIAVPLAACLRSKHLVEQVLYIVTTAGVPLRIIGTSGTNADAASVDSELTLLYSDMRGLSHSLPGVVPNPFFGQKDAQFGHPMFPIYLVTRLAGYDFADIKGIIDRALVARNHGKFVIDLKADDSSPGNGWLREAALALPKNRVVLDETKRVIENERDVIGYAAWGSNDPERKQRHLGFQWLPGAIMTEFVSSNGRTFGRPPDSWTLGNWNDAETWFAGAPQTLTADYIHDGVTGASGHVYEPFLALTPRPNILLPAYYSGRNLAESYYLAIPALSWMNIVIGDPLCAIGKP